MTNKEVMQMSLDALNNVYITSNETFHTQTIKTLRTALAQPEKEWVGLTDEEIKACAKGGRSIGISFHDAIRKAEAKLREKNET